MADLDLAVDCRVALTATTDAMAVVDTETDRWRIRAVNEPFERAVGRDEASVRGEPLAAVLGFDPRRTSGDGDSVREQRIDSTTLSGDCRLRICPVDGADAAMVTVASERALPDDPATTADSSLDAVGVDRTELVLFNKVLRHSMLNGLNLIRARLDLMEADVAETSRDHYETASVRVDDLIEHTKAVREMQTDSPADTEARPLDSVLEARVDSVDEAFPEATFRLDSVPEVDVEVDGLVHVCLRNVLRNAVQHADVDAPTVDVRVSVDGDSDTARVTIADNGAGLPTNLDRSIFAEGVSRRDGDGHGVGLFLTKLIVEENYGGAIDARESDRGGTEIVLDLPVATP